MNGTNPQVVGWMTLIGGVVGVVGFISLMLLFVVGEPFGTINDVLATPTAFLLLPLVVALYRLHAAEHATLSFVALLAGIVGFFGAAAGSALLVLRQISFEQSLIFGIGGFGLIGLWLLINCVLSLRGDTLPRGAAWVGLLLAVVPSLALLAVFRADGVARGLLSLGGQTAAGMQAHPLVYAFVALAALSYGAIPLWFVWVGRLILAGRWQSAAAALSYGANIHR